MHLRHRNLQRHADNTEQMRAIFDDPSGWSDTLARFAAFATVQTAHANFADLLSDLLPQQWEQPSLRERWRVKDVVAHALSYDELTRWQLAWRFVKGGFWPNRINAIGVAEYANRSPEQLVELMRASSRRNAYAPC
ncbi:hypothetical protein AWC32_23405 [Mycobacterium xenopi]|uniref:Mycothiol-dependent maleylpyruvate isomerase metal-binding domain-containing protein n=2 Tax=Mycobacterium xenopi TaxID=1789 RepID=A0AAD1M1V8_MYCXE|nr:mycothiol maleylpyruvate isomerase N-terminal domain protein [Mycobacterium xenopi 4042]ORX21453.1 hypothetical protein AWC32_23405 [Mycobacterium xenopi]BBU23257.1 hypothetical protein MYXE_30470 [Mycobacterium xenopi]SPX88905.1 DinB family protein [Mycobacterium xenopi]